MHEFLRRTTHAAVHRLRQQARADDGFTIIEVIMSAVIVVVIAGGVLTGLDAAGRSSADLRHRSQAQELAHEDQERMRGMSAQQLSGLNETRQVTVDGTVFSVNSQGQFLSHTGGGASCGSDSADYVKVVSTVDWEPLNRRTSVVVQSIITPPIGGTLIVKVPDPSGTAGVAGASVTVTGADNASAITDSTGCAIFAGLEPDDYDITASKAGYIDVNGVTVVEKDDVHVSTSESAVATLDIYGQAGAINASFTTRVDGSGSPCATGPNYCTGQYAPSLAWQRLDAFNGVLQTRNATSPNGSTTIRTHATDMTLFPFAPGGDTTNNWPVWGGRCIAAKPPDTDLSKATVNPGTTAAAAVRLPALIVKVTYAGTHVTPNVLRLRDACDQVWSPALRPGPPDTSAGSVYNALGTLQYPGQPYAPAGNTYDVCVEYDPPGAVTTRRVQPTTANANFTVGTPLNVALTSSSPTAACQF